jgi:hypothetical protein
LAKFGSLHLKSFAHPLLSSSKISEGPRQQFILRSLGGSHNAEEVEDFVTTAASTFSKRF